MSATKSVQKALRPPPDQDAGEADLETVYREHGGWLIGFLRRRFRREDAEEIAQETYVRAARSGLLFRDPRALLARIAINAARDQARRRTVRPVLVADDHALDAAEAAGGQAEAVLLKEIILALPPRLREVFLLSRFGGLTYEEIAHRCGLSVKTVEGRMTKALAMCAARIRD